ncbi:MAG: hypothetical protein MJ229_04855 [bacterium]|nr:hypothetical protein [bacterium]
MSVTFQSVNLINDASKVNFGKKKDVTFSAYSKQPEASKKVKAGVFATTLLGVSTATALCMKGKGFNISNKEGILNGLKKLEYEGYVVPAIAAGSIGGGLLGGALFDDKRNMKAKLREAAIQMFANVLIPLFCVEKLGGLFKSKVKNPIMKKMNLPLAGENLPKKARVVAGLFDIGSLVFSLGSAMVLGNKATNLMNEKIYNIRDDREVKVADLSGHVDDTCLALSRAFDKTSPIGAVSSKISRIIPAALLVCGYSSGVVQEWPDDVKELRKVDPSKPFRL